MVVVAWCHNIRYHESSETKIVAGDSWQEVRLVQYLCCAQNAACVARNWRIQDDGPVEPAPTAVREPNMPADRLSTIPEETERELSTPRTHQSSHDQEEVVDDAKSPNSAAAKQREASGSRRPHAQPFYLSSYLISSSDCLVAAKR